MYRLIIGLILGVLSATSARADFEPDVINIPLEKAYIPVGFDTNDRTQMVVTGLLPDTCYKIGPYQKVVDKNRKLISINQTAYHFGGMVCLRMIIPFAQVIDLETVERRGDYEVKDFYNSREIGMLSVAQATRPEIDDYSYAQVTDARVDKGVQDKHPTLVLDVSLTDRCTRYKETIVREYSDVIVVQPIAEHMGTALCAATDTRFRIAKELSSNVKGTYLLHVRTLNGQALNKIIVVD